MKDKQTTTIWSADLVKSVDAFEILIVDEGTGRTIIRRPVNVGDISSVLAPLKEAFLSFGAPAELRTDRGWFFSGVRFCDLLRSVGVSHTFASGRTLAERLARS
jgi:hypothetical protein